MMRKIKFIVISSFFIVGLSCKSQSKTDDLVFPKNITLPKEFSNQIEELKEGFYRVFQEDTTRVKNYTKEFISSKIDSSKNHDYIVIAKYWLAFNYEETIPELIERITNNKEIGLENTADLIIIERVKSGDLKFYGHGNMVADDLFKVSGRANHLLKEITGQNFGDVKMKSTEEELRELQKKWIEWLKSLND